jgi:tRNA-2-methylthio-N6-dimethylallyladenosine synthase
VRRYHVTTYGCQMNAHDSERIKGLLESAGLGEAPSAADADVLVFNTCTIREKADGRFLQHLMHARAMKQRDPGKQIIVGGCWSESMKDELFEEYPFVDFAFGPGAIARLGDYVGAGGSLPRGHFSTFDDFAGDLPMRRERPHQAWLQISMGCNSVCSYCIVPSVRGRERSRPWQDLVGEARRLAADGVRELTLLGQNVNSYGRDLPVGNRLTFAELIRELDTIPGLERVRYTSPHPKDMRADVIAALAECRVACEHMHLPLQSGSSQILKRMRRTYDRDRYLALVERIRTAIPDIALTTDVIVGFPGETEADFAETVAVYDEVGFDHAFTFIYSPRTGTEAAAMDGQVPEEVKRARIERLVERVQHHARRRNEALVGTLQEVLVEGTSRTDEELGRGRSRGNKTVLFTPPAPEGALVQVRIDSATSQTLRGTAQVAIPA